MPRPLLAALALFIAAAVPLAEAKTLYKLVDRNGRTTYVDQVPKGFDGEVTEIQTDPAPPPSASPPPAPRGPAKSESAKRDINSERRDARERLQLALDRARTKLEAAKKSLADGGEVADDEFQTIQQRSDASGAKPGAAGPRPNCFQQTAASGRAVWVCPTVSPGEKYRDRQKGLEDAVRSAEAEVAAAEDAYRRGTD